MKTLLTGRNQFIHGFTKDMLRGQAMEVITDDVYKHAQNV